ncbi:MAG: NADP-dependent oxidoreductase [Thermoanaerobaculia bacterium]|nr:NADP-dependent oxidoreductase [Thermoanaerobaculia bacterium]
MNTQILFRSRPAGEPHESNFRRVQHGIPTPLKGEILCRTIWLSLDPYMRPRMNETATYTDPVDFGQVMVGATVGQVVESHVDGFAAGDFVLGFGGWQSYWLTDGSDLRKLDPALAPISTALGVLGMPGLTAYVTVMDIAAVKSGETAVVSAAAGAVGSAAGQIAKIRGCRVVGLAGSDEKCRWVTGELGFDACINYKTSKDLDAALAKAAPDGIDAYVENVGGPVGEAAMRNLKVGGRVALVGLISQYNERKQHHGLDISPLLWKRATLRGMIVRDHVKRTPDFLRDASGWLREGKLKYRETIVDGLDNAPHALLGLFHGENIGKMLVQVAPDPSRSC